jgi:hypothetical protein
MQRARHGVMLLLLLLPTLAQAASIWVAWELDLEGHAPPRHFLLSVRSPSGAAVPPATQVPWATCPQIAGAQHCAQIGCPPWGIYEFEVRAVYDEGTSAPSNTWRCEITARQGCQCTEGSPSMPPPVVRQPPPPPPPPLILLTQIPPLPQHGPEGLNLQPVGELPQAASIPAIPASGGG